MEVRQCDLKEFQRQREHWDVWTDNFFAGSHAGAQSAAMFYSFFATCKHNNVDPFTWLKRVLEIIPDYPANQLSDLLPQNLNLA